MMGSCFIAGATAGLHALGVAKRSLRAMIIASAIYLGCSLVGAYLDGAVGTIRGAALATWLGAVVWWSQLRVAMRESDKIPQAGRRLRGPAGRRAAAPALSAAADQVPPTSGTKSPAIISSDRRTP